MNDEDLRNELMSKITAAINYNTIAAAISTEDLARVLNRVIVHAIEYYDWDELIKDVLDDIDLRGMLINRLRAHLTL
jgi:hypothetical protein